jgi:hypothetical protein
MYGPVEVGLVNDRFIPFSDGSVSAVTIGCPTADSVYDCEVLTVAIYIFITGFLSV